MPQTDPTHEAAPVSPTQKPRRSRIRRYVFVYYIVFAVLLLLFLPPYISVSRYQRRIADGISQSLGRPAHLDKVTLNLLPVPSFTLENLVVTEDPAFGSEPIIRANSVRANLRFWPLLSRKVEFSSITFTEPSVNLVHLPNGKWNLQSILIQAAHLQAAPTDQRSSGSAPRFPYIEATGARINLKLGTEKMPISLNDATLALWLPNPQEWHLRLEAHPARTDTTVTDAGILHLEGTIGRAPSLNQVPLSLDAQWSTAPLGGVTQLLLGSDANIRGDMNLTAAVRGTIGSSALTSRLRLTGLRRAAFIPERPLSVDLNCRSSATNSFHSFPHVECFWLPSGATPGQALTLTAAIPDVRNFDSASARLTTDELPFATALDWLRTASPRMPADLTAQGTFTGSLEDTTGLTRWRTHWEAGLQTEQLILASPQSGLPPLTIGDLSLESLESAPPSIPRGRHVAATPAPAILQLAPATLDLGGKDPATLEAHIDSTGYTLHLTGMIVPARLLALGKAIPQLGDGLKDLDQLKEATPDEPTGLTDKLKETTDNPIPMDLTATRPWGGSQTWQEAAPAPARPHHPSR